MVTNQLHHTRPSPLCPRAFAFLALCLLAILATARSAAAVEVTIPLNLDYVTLQEALKHQVFNGPDDRAVLWTGADQCQYLHATNPRFSQKDRTLVLAMDSDLSLGLAIDGKCVTPITWSGIIEVDTAPYVGPDLAIKFHVVNLNLYNPAHQKTVLLHGFDLIKSHLTPRLEDFSYDLGEPLRQLGDLMEAAADPDAVPRVKAALATMRPLPAVVPDDNGLELSLQLDVPATAATPSPASAAPLTPAELAAWQATLDHWDAFIVFAVKQLAGAVADLQFRDQLFDLLLDSRYRLVAALSQPQANTGPDPIRLIFIDEWTRLRTIIQAAARRGMLGSRALEFLSFITAGDALFAADQAAPALGMHISSDDLRRLARLMAPQSTADPLAFSYDQDPQLQQLFGFTGPLESPGPLEESLPENAASSPAPPNSIASPIAAAPNSSPMPTSNSIPTPTGSVVAPATSSTPVPTGSAPSLPTNPTSAPTYSTSTPTTPTPTPTGSLPSPRTNPTPKSVANPTSVNGSPAVAPTPTIPAPMPTVSSVAPTPAIKHSVPSAVSNPTPMLPVNPTPMPTSSTGALSISPTPIPATPVGPPPSPNSAHTPAASNATPEATISTPAPVPSPIPTSISRVPAASTNLAPVPATSPAPVPASFMVAPTNNSIPTSASPTAEPTTYSAPTPAASSAPSSTSSALTPAIAETSPLACAALPLSPLALAAATSGPATDLRRHSPFVTVSVANGSRSPRSWFRLFSAAEADAAESAPDPLATQIFSLGTSLKLVVADQHNAAVYGRSVLRLLTLVTQRESDYQSLQWQYRRTYLNLVKSTAWQESCWRQFVRVNGRVRFLESATDDVGMMQVNRHVWRGFYSIPRLEWDVVYNVGAGAEILLRLMTSAEARPSAAGGAPVTDIARSTYAAYNGGPGAFNRWRRPDEPAQTRAIDQSFWPKFKAIAGGQLFDILSCAAHWGHH